MSLKNKTRTPFSKTSKLSIFLDRQSEMLFETFWIDSLKSPSRGIPKHIKTKELTTCFHLGYSFYIRIHLRYYFLRQTLHPKTFFLTFLATVITS